MRITPRYCWNPRLVGRLSPSAPTPRCHLPANVISLLGYTVIWLGLVNWLQKLQKITTSPKCPPLLQFQDAICHRHQFINRSLTCREAMKSSSSPPIKTAEWEYEMASPPGHQALALQDRFHCKGWRDTNVELWIFHLETAGRPVSREEREGEHTFQTICEFHTQESVNYI